MQDLVESGVPLVISLAEPPGYERFSTCEQNYQLLTDVDGRVLLMTGYDLIGLESAETALLVVGLTFTLANLAAAGAKAGIRSLVRTFSKDASKRMRPTLPRGIIFGEPPCSADRVIRKAREFDGVCPRTRTSRL